MSSPTLAQVLLCGQPVIFFHDSPNGFEPVPGQIYKADPNTQMTTIIAWDPVMGQVRQFDAHQCDWRSPVAGRWCLPWHTSWNALLSPPEQDVATEPGVRAGHVDVGQGGIAGVASPTQRLNLIDDDQPMYEPRGSIPQTNSVMPGTPPTMLRCGCGRCAAAGSRCDCGNWLPALVDPVRPGTSVLPQGIAQGPGDGLDPR